MLDLPCGANALAMSTLDDATVTSNSEISPKAVDDFKASAPWMKFIAILGFIFAVLAIIGALMVLSVGNGVPGVGFIAVMYLVFGGLYGYVSYLLWQWATNVGNYGLTRDPRQLETAFAKQKAWWMTVGIITIVAFFLGIIMAIAAPNIFRPEDFRSY